ncbi:MAG: hypothetical protein L0I76_04200 [Pseudonocardia sp.]|nr:hypothetical protein [Pseudonocardia sp.]
MSGAESTLRRRARAASAPNSLFLLAAGAVLLVLSQHGNPGIGLAGWLFAIPLLRYARQVSVWTGALALAAIHAVAAVAWVLSIQLPTDDVPWAAIVGCVLLNLILVLPFVADRLIAVRLRAQHPVPASLVFPSARVAAELVVLTVSPFGSVFGSLAASQHDNLTLLQLASVTGAYGISFLMAWFGSAVCELWQRPGSLRPAGIVAAVTAVVLAAGAVVLALPPGGDTVRVAGITPPRAQESVSERVPAWEDAARDPAAVRRVMTPVTEGLLESSRREAAAGARIVLWSEAATLVHETDLPELIRAAAAIADEHDAYLLMTAGVFTEEPPYGRNIVAMVGPDGRHRVTYDKVHPVAGLEDIRPGTLAPPVLATEYGRVAAMICYDLDFADTAGVDADVVLLPAADWEGFDRLHTQKAAMRAVEYGYAVVRQDSHGTAATFDAHGRTLATADYFRTDQQVMSAEVPTAGARTVYATIGDAFAYGCVLVLIGLLAVSVVLRRRG